MKASAQDKTRCRYMVTIDRPVGVDLAMAREIFRGLPVRVDERYGVLMLEPKLNRHVLLVHATERGRRLGGRIPGVRFFADPGVEIAK